MLSVAEEGQVRTQLWNAFDDQLETLKKVATLEIDAAVRTMNNLHAGQERWCAIEVGWPMKLRCALPPRPRPVKGTWWWQR